MSILESLKISLNGFGVVFIVLIAICFLVIIESKLVSLFVKKVNSNKPEEAQVNDIILPVSNITFGELKLIDVDEKTAAMVMAIVSDESSIPLSELNFKSIKALN